MSKDLLYLTHILECIEKIEAYTVDGFDMFANDMKTQDATLRNLHVLAESATRISESLQSQYPDVPWRSIAAFRNVVVHDYLGLELHQVWAILSNDLPSLKQIITEMLGDIE